jgi:tryptophan synthase alpha chain
VRLAAAVREVRRRGPAIMPYVIPGFPDPATSDAVLARLEARPEIPIVEMTVPVAGGFAESTGRFIAEVHAIARRDPRPPARAPGKPRLCVVYREHYAEIGFAAFLDRYPGAWDGVVLEWPEEDTAPFRAACRARGIELVVGVGPGMIEPELRAVLATAEPDGLVYMSCAAGTGGELLPGELIAFWLTASRAIRPDLTFACGLGIQTPAHVATVAAAGADAVIVGTAFLRAMADGAAAADAYLDAVRTAAGG